MTSGSLSPILRSVSLLVALALLPCASRAHEHEVGDAGGSNSPFRARRLAGVKVNVTEVAKLLAELPAGKIEELRSALNKSDDNLCPDETVTGWAICTGEEVLSKSVEWVFVNPVAYPAAFMIATLVNTVGQWSLTIVSNYSWNTWPSSIVVLNMFFKHQGWLSNYLRENPVLFTLMFNAFQAALYSWFASSKRGIATRLELSRREAEIEDEAQRTHIFISPEEVHVPPLDGSTDLVVGNRYQELTHSFTRVLALFLVQSALFIFFIYELHENKSLHAMETNASFCKWLVAVGIIFVVSEGDQLGGVYDGAYWRTVLSVEVRSSDSGSDSSGDEKLGLKGYMSRQCFRLITLNTEWQVRRVMSFLVNGVFRAIILSLAPILLSQATELNFIKDSMAVFFITTLDDLSEKKSMVREIAYAVNDQHPEVEAWCQQDKRPPSVKQANLASEFSSILEMHPSLRLPSPKHE